MQLSHLFPTAVGEFYFNRPFTPLELKSVHSQATVRNIANHISVDMQVLELAVFAEIKAFIAASVDEYFATVYNPMYDVKLKITQSWLNYTNTREEHHAHAHSNSLVSGVFYIQTDAAFDKIHFMLDRYNQIQIAPKEYNIHNAQSWWLSADTGKLILFPSSLVHKVEPVLTNSTRVSLSFNTFPVGQLGAPNDTTSVVLP